MPLACNASPMTYFISISPVAANAVVTRTGRDHVRWCQVSALDLVPVRQRVDVLSKLTLRETGGRPVATRAPQEKRIKKAARPPATNHLQAYDAVFTPRNR